MTLLLVTLCLATGSCREAEIPLWGAPVLACHTVQAMDAARREALPGERVAAIRCRT